MNTTNILYTCMYIINASNTQQQLSHLESWKHIKSRFWKMKFRITSYYTPYKTNFWLMCYVVRYGRCFIRSAKFTQFSKLFNLSLCSDRQDSTTSIRLSSLNVDVFEISRYWKYYFHSETSFHWKRYHGQYLPLSRDCNALSSKALSRWQPLWKKDQDALDGDSLRRDY